jgi:hypothetical protein
MALEIANQIQSEVGVTVPPVKILEGLSTAGMAAFVIEQLTEDRSPSSAPPSTRQETAEQLMAKVDQLSDQEVDLLLREMVGEEIPETKRRGKEMSQ